MSKTCKLVNICVYLLCFLYFLLFLFLYSWTCSKFLSYPGRSQGPPYPRPFVFLEKRRKKKKTPTGIMAYKRWPQASPQACLLEDDILTETMPRGTYRTEPPKNTWLFFRDMPPAKTCLLSRATARRSGSRKWSPSFYLITTCIFLVFALLHAGAKLTSTRNRFSLPRVFLLFGVVHVNMYLYIHIFLRKNTT